MAAKKDHFNTQFHECGGDQVHVVKVAKQQPHHKGAPAMPKHDNLHSLVNEFSQFFTMEISKIKDQMAGTANSQLLANSTAFIGTKLTQF